MVVRCLCLGATERTAVISHTEGFERDRGAWIAPFTMC